MTLGPEAAGGMASEGSAEGSAGGCNAAGGDDAAAGAAVTAGTAAGPGSLNGSEPGPGTLGCQHADGGFRHRAGQLAGRLPRPGRLPRGGAAGAGRRREPAVWLVAPGTFFFVLIVGIPLVIVVWTSFLRIGASNIASWATAPFAGFANYVTGLTGPNVLGVSVLDSVWISVKFSLLATVASTPIAFFAALSVYHRFRGRALLRSVYLLPYVMPGFVIALLAQLAFHDTSGSVDKLLAALHIAPVTTFWLIGPNAFWALTFTEVWEVWPFIYLLLLAGLQAIPREQLEAATVDGAGWWARLRYIVIPQLKGIYVLAFCLSSLYHFGNFTLPYIMFGNTRPSDTVTLPINIYYIAFNGFDFGVASATAVFNVLLLAVPAAVYLWIARSVRRQG